MACFGNEPHDMQLLEEPYEEYVQEMADKLEEERCYLVQAAQCTVCDYLGFQEKEDPDDVIMCKACNPEGEHPWHPAHVLIWQVGDEWVPSCSDRVLTWWDDHNAPREAGAPLEWIKPLPTA